MSARSRARAVRAAPAGAAPRLLLDALLPPLLVGERLRERDGFGMQARVDKESVHVRAEQIGADERAEAKTLELVARDEAVVVVQLAAAAARLLILLELLGQGVEEGAPARRGPERGHEVDAEVGLLEAEQEEAGARAERQLVDVGRRLDRRHRAPVLAPPDAHGL